MNQLGKNGRGEEKALDGDGGLCRMFKKDLGKKTFQRTTGSFSKEVTKEAQGKSWELGAFCSNEGQRRGG